jgi:hypothetical protein
MALGFAARQCFGLMRKIKKPLPADEQVGDDAGRAAVETCVRRLLAISGVRRAHLGAHLIEPRRQPLDVTGHRLRIEATGRIPLTRAQPLGADVAGRYFDQEQPCDQAFPRRSLFPGRQDQGAWWMDGAQRVVGLQASAAGAVGGGAQ